jgi:dihydrofolate synthase/folylpolyglutamate synthase
MRGRTLDYFAALQYLYDLTDYEKELIDRYDPETFDLSRVKQVLARLENPQQRFPSIHIAGTKGKGSVAAMCASVLQAAGFRTGLYTSPHLHTFRERIRVNGELIAPEPLVALVQKCRPIFDSEPELTTFEAITVLAFMYFAQREIDYAVIEVGLGGRLDATNVITPRVAVITSLSFDHMYLLGNTLADIAREKAGIIKPDVPTVCAPQDTEALAVIEQICAERGAPLTIVGRDWTWEMPTSPPERLSPGKPPLGLDGQSFEVRCAHDTSDLEGAYTIPLLGRHQVKNAVAAIAALDWLRREGVPLRPHHLRYGLANVHWPGRFEILRKDPPLVVDCAHNGDSVAKLVDALGEWFPGRRWTFILGVSKDKDLTGMLRELAPRAERVIATQSRHMRAMPPKKVAELAAAILPPAGAPLANIEVSGDAGEALNLAFKTSDSAQNPLARATLEEQREVEGRGNAICVTGSIFVVADVREVWALHNGGDVPETDQPLACGLCPLDDYPAPQTEAIAR